jgi:hypothetical protein
MIYSKIPPSGNKIIVNIHVIFDSLPCLLDVTIPITIGMLNINALANTQAVAVVPISDGNITNIAANANIVNNPINTAFFI